MTEKSTGNLFQSARQYGPDAMGANTSVGNNTQINPTWYWKAALIEIVKEQHFSRLANVRMMPKHRGKTIEEHHYLPLLDDRNVSDQGIDAAGNVTSATKYYVWLGGSLVPDATIAGNSDGFNSEALAKAATGFSATAGHIVQKGAGNLYASSKDIGTIMQRLPVLGEHGGRVNRVGFTRKTIKATLEKFGFFDEYTMESKKFDTDASLMMHIGRETMRGANEITEDMLQIDLINNAGNVWYTGDATSIADIQTKAETGNNAHDSVLTYDDLVRVAVQLNRNRCPKHTEMIVGSRMIDTRVVNSARYIYAASELMPTFKAMKDYHNERAFKSVETYAHAGNIMFMEEGAIDNLRIISVNEMIELNGRGATVSNAGTSDLVEDQTNLAGVTLDNDGSNYNVYPLLIVGSGSFTTIGFQQGDSDMKFEIFHKPPGEENADRNDPFGETGFYSIKWYYAFMALRPEWITVIYTGIHSGST